MSVWKREEMKVQKDAEIGRLAQIISELGAQIQRMKEGRDNPQQKPQLSPILHNLINNMVRVEGGNFIMGATDEQVDPENDEKPISKVTISSFAINKYEVTQAEWEYVMGENPSEFKGRNNPVDSVTWEDCQTFISRLNLLTGMNFRFLTEAEWEFAARGGIKGLGCQFAGTNDVEEAAWYTVNSSNSSHPVGLKMPNELGLYDMSGNVWEWCQDWFAEYSEMTKIDPIGPSTGLLRIIRGGSWLSSGRSCRVSNRHYNAPTDKDNNIGLRLAL
jgi:formylglycine-generating enzyme required for sulfatase activity